MAGLGLYGLARAYFTVFAPRLGGAGEVLWQALLYFGAVAANSAGLMRFIRMVSQRPPGTPLR